VTVLRSLAYRRLDDLLVVVHHFGELEDADWQALVDATKSLRGKADKCLVLPGGAHLTRAQSAQIAEVVLEGRMRVAVLMEGRAVRGVVTALGWLTKRYRGFGPTAVTEALTYLSISPERRGGILQALNELGSGLARPEVRVG
jgi:hypothetical protein